MPTLTALIPDIEIISMSPRLFFTLRDGNNSKSIVVIQELGYLLLNQEKYCRVFDDIQAIRSYFVENNIEPVQAVAIFDHRRIRKCFSPIYRPGAAHIALLIPEWVSTSAMWGVAVSPRLPEKRLRTIVCQIKADFYTNFLSRLKSSKPQLPWGQIPSSSRLKQPKFTTSYDSPRLRPRSGHNVWS
jgi:hypothetical protein